MRGLTTNGIRSQLEIRFERLEVLAARRAQKCFEYRRAFDVREVRGILAVEQPQWIALDASPRIVAHRRQVRRESAPAAPRGRRGRQAASPIELMLSTASSMPYCATSSHAKRDDFEVRLGAREAEALDAELMRLAIASLLRTLVAKDRADVVEPQRPDREEAVLEHGPHDRRRPFWAQRDASAAPIVERVHLLFHDVGLLTDAAHEEIGGLEDRRANLAISEPSRQPVNARFEFAPAARLRREKIRGAARRVEAFSGIRLHFG